MPSGVEGRRCGPEWKGADVAISGSTPTAPDLDTAPATSKRETPAGIAPLDPDGRLALVFAAQRTNMRVAVSSATRYCSAAWARAVVISSSAAST